MSVLRGVSLHKSTGIQPPLTSITSRSTSTLALNCCYLARRSAGQTSAAVGRRTSALRPPTLCVLAPDTAAALQQHQISS